MFFVDNDHWWLLHYDSDGQVIGIDEANFGSYDKPDHVDWPEIFISLIEMFAERNLGVKLSIVEVANEFLKEIDIEYWSYYHNGEITNGES